MTTSSHLWVLLVITLTVNWANFILQSAAARPSTKVAAHRSGLDARNNPVPLLDLAAALSLFRRGDVLFVDVRSPAHWRAGRIQGAKPLAQVLKSERELEGAKQARVVILYCESASCFAAVHAAKKFANDIPSLAIYMGGWAEWNRLGLPVEHDD